MGITNCYRGHREILIHLNFWLYFGTLKATACEEQRFLHNFSNHRSGRKEDWLNINSFKFLEELRRQKL